VGSRPASIPEIAGRCLRSFDPEIWLLLNGRE
jgi:hypothetical protein